MANVTVPIRLDEEEYQKYRLIALKQRKSFAELVRQSLERANWTYEDTKVKQISKQAAKRILSEKGFSSNLSIREMVEYGRK